MHADRETEMEKEFVKGEEDADADATGEPSWI